jgi:hypothetical protein
LNSYPELYEKAVRKATQGCTPINAINNRGVVDIAHLVYADALTEANKLLEQTIEVLEGFPAYMYAEHLPNESRYPRPTAEWYHGAAKPLLDNLKAWKKEPK